MKITKKVWVIMSKDRKFIAKGVPRDRYIASVDDEDDKKRILTYSSESMAKVGFKSGFFNMGLLDGYTYGQKLSDFVEAVECEMTLTETKE